MNGITKRQLLTAAAAAAIATPALAQQDQELYAAAQKEGELTWYSGHVNAETSEAIGAAFTKLYPGVKVNVVRSTSQVAFQRLSQDMRAGVAQCDVFSSTDVGHSLLLKREGKYLQYKPKNVDKLVPAVRDMDPDGYFTAALPGVWLMSYNSAKLPDAQAPQSWKACMDPKWKDQLAIGHPSYSGAIGTLAVMLRKMYGWDYFKALEKNNPLIGRSSDDPVTSLDAGERTVGLGTPIGTVLTAASRGNPIKLIYPEDGSLLLVSPSGIPKNAPHPNAAKLFIEFMGTKEYSVVLTQYFSLPMRTDVPPPPGARGLDQIKVVSPTTAEVEAGIPEIKELWRDTFGV